MDLSCAPCNKWRVQQVTLGRANAIERERPLTVSKSDSMHLLNKSPVIGHFFGSCRGEF
jgi:hypothetical protein